MHKISSRDRQKEPGTRALSLQYRAALLAGSLCLAVSITLALLGALSARYIVEQQAADHGAFVASKIASQIAPILATSDLIMLEVSLEQMREEYALLALAVSDVEQRPLGQAGSRSLGVGTEYSASILIDNNLAGELRVTLYEASSDAEVQRMSLALAALAILLSVFAAVLGAKWGQRVATRIDAVNTELSLVQERESRAISTDELLELENAVAALPLDLLKPPASASTSTANYRDAGLLFIHLDSLGKHVETLDESSLLAYTELHRRLIQSAADLYAGKLSVIRQFGVLVSFDNGHTSGSPAFRTSSCAWLIQKVAEELSANRPMRIKLSLACGLSETGTGTSQDIYPDLYNQYLIDELANLADSADETVLLTPAVSSDPEVQNRCQFGPQESVLAGFMEPYCDLLERQQELLLRELR